MYIHQTTCISPQPGFDPGDAGWRQPVGNKLLAIEPVYENIPPGLLRRMGKAVRFGVGAAMPVLSRHGTPLDGIIIGTPMGGLEDCIKFLNQIIEYDEGRLTPTNFVQSTPNAIAGQLSILNQNKGYNITHVHRGFSFENALLDASMLLRENPAASYLVGSVDEISAYNYNIEYLGGWYKTEMISGTDLYLSDTPASIAGEGAAMFRVAGNGNGAMAEISAIHFFQTADQKAVARQLKEFLIKHCADDVPDLLLSGENGDNRFLKFYQSFETITAEVLETTEIPTGRFKHLCGEYAAASSFAAWLACELIREQRIPPNILKAAGEIKKINSVLLYNNYKGLQHSLILFKCPRVDH